MEIGKRRDGRPHIVSRWLEDEHTGPLARLAWKMRAEREASELAKQLIAETCARQGDAPHYGRTAYIVTPDVEEVTALFHLLARYVVNTEPISIVEELLPVAVPVYGGSPLDAEATQRLLRVSPSSETRTEAEVQEALADALVIEELETLLHGAVEARRQHLATERRTMREQMEQRGGAQTAEWLRGIDDLAPGSFDLLAVTVLFPG